MNKKFLNNNYLVILIIALVSIVLILLSNMVISSLFKLINSLNNKSLKPNFSLNDLFNFQLKYRSYYLVVVAIVIFSDIKIVYTMKTSFKNINQGQKVQVNLQR